MNDKQFKTDPLSDAMQELIDICQQYNDKLSDKRKINKKQDITEVEGSDISGLKGHQAKVSDDGSFKGNKTKSVTQDCDSNKHFNCSIKQSNNIPKNNMELIISIERLQQRQCELQKQLDEVLTVSKSLEMKQKRKLDNTLEDYVQNSAVSDDVARLESDDDELIEFQQIENELKISELNRQLSNIQEELRLTLYKRLLSSTTNAQKSCHAQGSRHTDDHADPPVRRNSAQTDESTPPSSSCSDEQTATSLNVSTSADMMTPRQQQNSISATSSNNSFDLASQFAERLAIGQHSESQQLSASNIGEFYTFEKKTNNDTNSNENSIKLNSRSKSYEATPQANHQTDIDMVLEQINNYEILLPPMSRYAPQHSISNEPSRNQDLPHGQASAMNQHSMYASGYRGGALSNANKDLERIDEGEEDDQDYCSSDKLRTIYEEKLSPLIRAETQENSFQPYRFNYKYHDDQRSFHVKQPISQQTIPRLSKPSEIRDPRPKIVDPFKSPEANYDRFNPNNVNSSKRYNRPLTMYLPKPDENIDLVEHIQALGHDINIISSDLELNSTSASGYLYKSCSNNQKKWLKRFFYFDRELKTLSYYENKEQVTKKNCPPKNCIPFDDIGDVYVDHSLSKVSDKQKNSKKSSYVFVLATTKRRYTLSSPKAETMRAWIDILFTAAKANDYFQHLDDGGGELDDDSGEASYSSFKD